jgi:hypothetical protein
MTEAVSTDVSPKARATFREIAFALGRLSEQKGRVADAIAYYDKSISWQPDRTRDQQRAVTAALYIAEQLLWAEKADDSRKYLDIGRAYCRPGSPEALQFDALERLSEPGRRRAILRCIPGKGFGFLGNDRASAIFLHHSGVIPRVTVTQFDQLEGREFSFVVIDRDGKPVAAWAYTRSPRGDARSV